MRIYTKTLLRLKITLHAIFLYTRHELYATTIIEQDTVARDKEINRQIIKNNF